MSNQSSAELAFPLAGGASTHRGGMTLRDYFAAKAMQGYMSTPERQSFSYEKWAQAAYDMADAMLAERERTP